MIFDIFYISDEFKGHSLLEGCRQADVARVKKYLEVVNFKHPYSGDTALVSHIILYVNKIRCIQCSYGIEDEIIWCQL